jgi:transposase
MKETITLNAHEQKRLMVLNRLVVGQLTAAEAAEVLDLSERQVRRLLAAYRKEGAAALAHGNRGRKPMHRISEEVRTQVISLATTTYRGCNYQHLRDLLAEREGIRLSRASVRRILLTAGMSSPRKQRRRQHRRRRTRYAQAGMLVQVDGSHHAWLGDRGPWLTLLAAIDDATGQLVAAVFRKPRRCGGLLPAGAAARTPSGALSRSAWHLCPDQQGSRSRDGGGTVGGQAGPHAIRAPVGRIRDHLDCRPFSASQRARGTTLWHPARSAWSSSCV